MHRNHKYSNYKRDAVNHFWIARFYQSITEDNQQNSRQNRESVMDGKSRSRVLEKKRKVQQSDGDTGDEAGANYFSFAHSLNRQPAKK